ncbi:MAG: CopG family transcriptional regulator [Cyanobacteria bacterium CRU_2_1]|nr:CopG family transcriptional regulator [Cyanobacteria bacterium CRU_2_1]
MTREKLLRVRLSNEEYERLKDYAEATDRQISEVIRDYIKRLPRKPEDGSR